MIKNRLDQYPFLEKYVHNIEWLPTGADKEYMGESYQKQVEAHNVAQSDVMFKDLHVEYDSDGGDYSFWSWPWKIWFNQHTEVECYFEDEGIYVDYKGYYFKFPDIKELTMGKFYDACQMFNIPLELTEYGQALYDTDPEISYEQQLYDDHIGKDGIPR